MWNMTMKRTSTRSIEEDEMKTVEDVAMQIEGCLATTNFMIGTMDLSNKEYLKGQLAGIRLCLGLIKEICDED